MIVFECSRKIGKKTERWNGIIHEIIRHGSHYEIRIESRSGIMLVFGKTSRGGFACAPDFGAGCHLVDLKDKFWNTETLTAALGKVDGITAAEALYVLAEKGVL